MIRFYLSVGSWHYTCIFNSIFNSGLCFCILYHCMLLSRTYMISFSAKTVLPGIFRLWPISHSKSYPGVRPATCWNLRKLVVKWWRVMRFHLAELSCWRLKRPASSRPKFYSCNLWTMMILKKKHPRDDLEWCCTRHNELSLKISKY